MLTWTFSNLREVSITETKEKVIHSLTHPINILWSLQIDKAKMRV